ncbi:MAG: immunoglobulin domain-containing protein [Limisphaerales bacterium]
MKLHQTQSNPRPGAWRLAARLGAITVAAALAGGAQAQTPVFSTLWGITNASFTDLPAAGSNVRGFAISPVTTNVVYASTAGGSNHVSTLDYANGYNKLGSPVAITTLGGTLALTQVRVSDDGKVYACNLSGGPASRFVIYRWESDTDFTAPPIVVYDSGAGTSFQWRVGDYMDLRGSGESTEIVVVGNGSGANITTNIVVFRPTDATATTFTNFTITIPGSSASLNPCGGGVAFEGTNNVVYLKQNGVTTVRRMVYDPTTMTAIVTNSFNMDQSANSGLKYYEVNGVQMIATVCAQNGTTTNSILHHGKVLQLTGPSNAVVVLNLPLPQPYAANGNLLGLVDAQKDHFVFSEPNNGVLFVALTGIITNPPPTNLPPTIDTISGGGTYIEGTVVTFSATASGSPPLSYQWYFNTNTPILGATTNTYAIPAVQLADAGFYSLVVTSPFGVVTSGFLGLSVLPGNFSNFASNLWTLGAGSRPYLTTGDTQRGMAYDPVSNVVVVVSRTPSNLVALLDADTGAEVGVLDVSVFNPPTGLPGIFPINTVGVADDGAVYVANLIISGSDNFALYRYQNADPLAFPSQAYLGNPGVTRLGDTISVRGAGVNTEILCAQRTGSNVVLFTTADGFNFTPTLISVTNLPDDAVTGGFAGLGLAYGNGNTFWAKSSNFRLRKVAYDAAAGTGSVIETYDTLTGSEAPIGVDNVNGYVAAVAFGQIPRNLSIWDVSQGPPNAVQLDRELFGSNNANGNGTGSVAFDVNGGRIFALNSNNGLIALAYAPRLTIDPTPAGGIVTWTGPGTLQASTNLASGVWTDLPAATSPHTNTAAKEVFFRVKR